jgi:hypothetical protein
MNSIKNIERLQQIHALIETETTGTPRELASRLHISERLVYHLIEQLKDYNATIRYDRTRKTYYYEDEFELHVKISVSIMSNNETTQLFGGQGPVKNLHGYGMLKNSVYDLY